MISTQFTLTALCASSLIVVLTYLVLRGHLIPNRPATNQFPVRGIDVSHHNGVIDWKSVSDSGQAFAFIKATEGSDWRDSRFQFNLREARKHNIVCGAYHFFSTTISGDSQADNFITTVPALPGMLPPVIDIEFSPAHSWMTDEQFKTHLTRLVERLKSHYEVKPIFYTTREFHDHYFPGEAIDPLWVRAVIGVPYEAAENWSFWQYSSRGRIPGIAGRTDLNVFRGSVEELVGVTSIPVTNR